MLSRWRKEYREGKIGVDKRKKTVSIQKEKTELNMIKRLEKENAQLKQEIGGQKTVSLFSKAMVEKYFNKITGDTFIGAGIGLAASNK